MKFDDDDWESWENRQQPKQKPKLKPKPVKKTTGGIRKELFPVPKYELQVTDLGKKYRYELLESGERKLKNTHDLAPIDCNTTTKFVQEFTNEMNGKIESSDPNAVVTKEAITNKIIRSLEEINDELEKHREIKSKRNAKAEARNKKEHDEILRKSWIELNELCMRNGITIIDFVLWLCTYMAVGEEKNVLVGFVCHLTTYFGMGTPLWFMPVGKTGEGKTQIEKSAAKLMPSDAIAKVGMMTHAAFMRSGQNDEWIYDCKILRLGDFGGESDFKNNEEYLNDIKELSSDGEISKMMVGDAINEETREKELVNRVLRGHCSASFTTVKSEDINEQYRNRGRLVTPQSSNAEVARFNRLNDGVNAIKVKRILKKYLPLIKNSVEYVKYHFTHCVVFNPYKKNTQEWFEKDEYFKRNDKQVSHIISSLTILNYESRDKIHTTIEDEDGELKEIEIVVSSLEDNLVVAELFDPSLGLTPIATGAFNILLDKYYRKKTDDGNSFHASCESDYSKTVEDEISDYENISSCTLRELKTIFSTKEAEQTVTSADKKYKGMEFSKILYALRKAGCVEEVTKVKKSSRQSVFRLTRYTKLGNNTFELDPDVYEEYNTEDVPIVFGDLDYTVPTIPDSDEIPVIIDSSKIREITVDGVGVAKWF